MKLSLTSRTVESLKPTRSPQVIIDTATRNLRITVRPNGRKVWAWVGRIDGTVRTFTLGVFPKYSLLEARAWAANINDLKTSGLPLPPMTRKEKALAEMSLKVRDKTHRTFDWLFGLYMEEEGNALASAHERWRIYRKDIKPAIGDMPIDEIKHDDLAKILRAKKASGAPTVSNTIQSFLRRVFRWGATAGRDLTGLEHDPAQFLVKLTAPKERDRYLTDYEIGIFFRALGSIDNTYGEAVTLALYLGMRRSEVFELTWDEVNFETGDIEIEGTRIKNDRALVLFMPDTVRQILLRRKEENGDANLVFPAIGSQAVDIEHGADHEGGSVKAFNAFSKHTKRLNSLCQKLAAQDGKSFPNFTIHDLRRTLSTGMHALKDDKKRSVVPTDVVERVLNHTIGGVRRVYNRHDYYEEKMDAIRAWASHLDSIKITASVMG